MYKFVLVVFLFTLSLSGGIIAQDTLPKITVRDISGKVIISWRNTYGAKISNINIQRSTDSTKRFMTIGTVLNPLNRENGYVDTKAPLGRIFYRVFVAFEGGDYAFTKSYRPVTDTTSTAMLQIQQELLLEERKETKQGGPIGFVPSKFVYTGKDNNVILNLPGAATRKFSIKFFDENDNPVFQINAVKEPYLIIEKVNFLHSGWFKYHLFDDEVLLEKFKFFIPKDGKNGANGREQRR